MTLRLTLRNVTKHRARLATMGAAVILALAAPKIYAQVRIGVVDIRRAVAETAEGRAASDAIKARFDARQAELNRRTRELENLKRRIEHPAPGTPPQRLQALAQRYQRQVMELQQLGQQYTAELQAIEAELTKQIYGKMQPIVRQIGQTENYQLIVDEQVVHFAPSNLNLTDQVIQQYNQRYPVRGPIQLPDAGPIAPIPTAMGMDAGVHDEDEIEVPSPRTVPADAGARGAGGIDAAATPAAAPDAGRRRLPGVFFRDGGR